MKVDNGAFQLVNWIVDVTAKRTHHWSVETITLYLQYNIAVTVQLAASILALLATSQSSQSTQAGEPSIQPILKLTTTTALATEPRRFYIHQ